jgi:hypothetical protein
MNCRENSPINLSITMNPKLHLKLQIVIIYDCKLKCGDVILIQLTTRLYRITGAQSISKLRCLGPYIKWFYSVNTANSYQNILDRKNFLRIQSRWLTQQSEGFFLKCRQPSLAWGPSSLLSNCLLGPFLRMNRKTNLIRIYHRRRQR